MLRRPKEWATQPSVARTTRPARWGMSEWRPPCPILQSLLIPGPKSLGSASLLQTRTRVHPVRAGAARNDTTAFGLRTAGGGSGRSRGDTERLAAPTTGYVRPRRQGADPAPSPARPRCCGTTGVRSPGAEHREVSTPEAAASAGPTRETDSSRWKSAATQEISRPTRPSPTAVRI